jgi:hypothetical protein
MQQPHKTIIATIKLQPNIIIKKEALLQGFFIISQPPFLQQPDDRDPAGC